MKTRVKLKKIYDMTTEINVKQNKTTQVCYKNTKYEEKMGQNTHAVTLSIYTETS